MEILLKDTQEVVTDFEFRNRYPNTSFPQVLSPELLDDFGAVAILEGPHATFIPPYEYNMRNGVEEINGQWFTKYVAGPIFIDNENQTAAEQLAEYKARIDEQLAVSIRSQRDQLLKESDWTQVADAPVDKEAWATYRQSLRDITTQETFPVSVVWPIHP